MCAAVLRLAGKRPGSLIYTRGDGYLYHAYRRNPENGWDVVSLRCAKYSTTSCPGKAMLITFVGEREVWHDRSPHRRDCPRDHLAVLEILMRADIYQFIRDNPYETAVNVINHVAAR